VSGVKVDVMSFSKRDFLGDASFILLQLPVSPAAKQAIEEKK